LICQAVKRLAQKSPLMKKIFLMCAAWLAALAVYAAPTDDLIARIHFVGAAQIGADTNSVAFTNLWLTPEARALSVQTLDKLACAPYEHFKAKMAPGTPDEAAQLRPLFDDLLKSEWFLEVRQTLIGSGEFAFAIRLDDARAKLWQDNLAAVLETWTRVSAKKISGGWQLKKHLPPDSVRCTRNGDWVVFACEHGKFNLGDALIQQVAATRRPVTLAKDYWLSVDADLPKLAKWFPALKTLELPATKMQVVGRNGDLLLNGKFIFADRLNLPLEKWQVPTNTIRGNFISFTAMRGLAPWLKKQDWAQPWNLTPTPNQFFIWALPQVPFQTFAATPVPSAPAALDQLEQRWQAHDNGEKSFIMPITMVKTNDEMLWQGMPFIVPSVKALHGKNGDFLLAGLFPNTPPKPLPPELFARLAPDNLVFYHWEITAERLPELRNVSQLVLVLTRHRQLEGDSAASKWLDRISPKLGNNVTEITQTGPNELSFKRKAAAGLTALELLALANWLEAPSFPHCDLKLPPPRIRPGQKQMKLLSVPAAPAPSPH
jgi:hypothetical protein